MELPDSFYTSLSAKSDAELMQMWVSVSEYSEEAREAARIELTTRGIPWSKLEQLRDESVARETREQMKRDEPMVWGERVACLFIPGFAMIYVKEIGRDGYRQKANEAMSYFVLHLIAFTVYKMGFFRR